MPGLALYFSYIKMNFKAGLQYKGWPFMVFQTLFVVITDPIGLILLFSRFGSIGEWSVERIVLIYAMAVASFGLAEFFCRGFDYFPWHMLRSGSFDRVLLRPCSIFVQVAASFFHIHRISRVLGGLGAIFWCLIRLDVSFTLPNMLMLFFALVGGFVMYSGVFVMASGIAFFTIQSLDWIYIFTNVSYQVTRCPIDYMPRIFTYMFTFLMPMLLISYYPASAICGWGENYYLGFLALPAGLLFFGASILVWRFGVRHYKSTGS